MNSAISVPNVSRVDPTYKESPVFGFAGFVLPSNEVRGFGTWFFQRKCDLLAFEIERSGKHPALWEKKGASLYTVTNVTRYSELRKLTNRLLNKIRALGGFVFYVGIRKTAQPEAHNPNRLYARVFLEAIKRIDGFCGEGGNPVEDFVLLLDEHEQRSQLIAEASRSMYARHERRRNLAGISSSRHSIWKAIAIGRSKRPTGLPGWLDGSGRSGPIQRLGPRMKCSAGTSSTGSISSAAGAASGVDVANADFLTRWLCRWHERREKRLFCDELVPGPRLTIGTAWWKSRAMRLVADFGNVGSSSRRFLPLERPGVVRGTAAMLQGNR